MFVTQELVKSWTVTWRMTCFPTVEISLLETVILLNPYVFLDAGRHFSEVYNSAEGLH